MPIIPVKDNPPTISFASSILEKEGIWCVAKVKPQHEKKVAFNFLDSGIDYYLPYYLKKVMRKDRGFRNSILVLFPTYVPFISSERSRALWHQGVEKVLKVEGQQRFKKELSDIFQALESGTIIEPASKAESFVRGEGVEIIAGHFKGREGVVVNTRNEGIDVLLSTSVLGNYKVTVNSKIVNSKKLAEDLSTKIRNESPSAKNIVLQKINKCPILTSNDPSYN